jgi:hypothetical protein
MEATGTPQALGRTAVDIGDALRGGWRLFTREIVPLLLGTLIATGLSIVTLGILAGPLFAGLYAMVIGRVRDGRPAEVGDVFSCMDRFWSFFGGAVVLFLIFLVTSWTIVVPIVLWTIWLYVWPLMVDRKMGFWDALGESYHMVVDNGFWEHLVLVVIFALLGSIGGWAFVLTTPFTIAATVAAYALTQGHGAAIERV